MLLKKHLVMLDRMQESGYLETGGLIQSRGSSWGLYIFGMLGLLPSDESESASESDGGSGRLLCRRRIFAFIAIGLR